MNSLEESLVGKLLKDQDFGISYESGDVNSFSNALVDLIENVKNKKFDKEKMISFFNENFDQKKVFKSYMNHIESSVDKIKSNVV